MALSRRRLAARRLFNVFIGAAVLSLFYRAIAAGEVGVNYGRNTDPPPDSAQVAKLLKDNGITAKGWLVDWLVHPSSTPQVRIYDTDAGVLKALANTGIKVEVTMPNDQVAAAASDRTYAQQWVQKQVAPYLPGTMIQGAAVGNEVFRLNMPELNSRLVQAMRNVHDALKDQGLDGAVKMSTPVAFDALKDPSFPPSAGRFKDGIASVMKDLLDFIQQTGSYLTVNIYPFFAYAAKSESPDKIPLDYALGKSQNPGSTDPETGLKYYSLLDAQIDAMYHAIDALGGSDSDVSETHAVQQPRSTYVTESGWPSGGTVHPPGGQQGTDSGDDGNSPASIANAQAFNNNLINRILSGNTGTPYRPDADLGVYIFALFNENKKGASDDVESHFGLFNYPEMTKEYPFSFVKQSLDAN